MELNLSKSYPYQIVWVDGEKRTTSIGGYSKQDMTLCATRLMSFEPDDQLYIEVVDTEDGCVLVSVYRDDIVDHSQE